MAVADFLSRNGGGGGCRPEAHRPETGGWGCVARGGVERRNALRGGAGWRRAGNQWASE